MSKDIRIDTNFRKHFKIKRLEEALGAEAVLCLISLWGFAGKHRQKGRLTGMNIKDIEMMAEWRGDKEQFVATLIDLKLLDKHKNGVFKIHNWKARNGYIYFAPERSEHAKKAAQARYKKIKVGVQHENKKSEVKIQSRLKSKSPINSNNLAPAQKTNELTPSPSPTPSPNPNPSPAVVRENKQQIDIKIKKIKEIIQCSNFNRALVGGSIDWLTGMVKYFKPPNYPEDHIKQALDALIKHQQSRGWNIWGDDNIRPKIWQWIEKQKKIKTDDDWDKFLNESD